MKLKNKVAIVTGGGKGIGAEISLRLAQEGAKIVIAEMDVESGKNIQKNNPIVENNKFNFGSPKSYTFNFRKAPDQTVTELFGHNTDAKWANILYVGQIPEKDIQALEKNQRAYNKVKKAIDNEKLIQFKNEIFSITKIR